MLNSAEKDIIFKLINLKSKPTKTNYGSKNQKTQIELEEKLLPTVTNINSLKKVQGNIIK